MPLLAKISCRLASVTGIRALFCFVQRNLPPRVNISFLPFHYLHNNNNKLQLGCHLVAVVILHVYKI
jgi:hypothetical protein